MIIINKSLFLIINLLGGLATGGVIGGAITTDKQ